MAYAKTHFPVGMKRFQRIATKILLGLCLIKLINAQEVDPLEIQNTPVRVLDFRQHGNSLEAFRAAGVEVMPEWKYYGQEYPKSGEENTDEYVAGSGRYEILLPNNIRLRQDAYLIEVRLKREGRSYRTQVTDQITGLTISPNKEATLDDVRALTKSFSSQGGIVGGISEWLEKRENKDYPGDAGAQLPKEMNPQTGFYLKRTYAKPSEYAATVYLYVSWKERPNNAPEGFAIDWDVPAIMQSVPKPEDLHPLEAYVGIVGVEKLWELGMPKPKTMTAAEWLKRHGEGKEANDGIQPTHRKDPEVEKKPSPDEDAKSEEKSKLSWIIAGVLLLGIFLFLLKTFKGKSAP